MAYQVLIVTASGYKTNMALPAALVVSVSV
jgi:hypothetical protein